MLVLPTEKFINSIKPKRQITTIRFQDYEASNILGKRVCNKKSRNNYKTAEPNNTKTAI